MCLCNLACSQLVIPSCLIDRSGRAPNWRMISCTNRHFKELWPRTSRSFYLEIWRLRTMSESFESKKFEWRKGNTQWQTDIWQILFSWRCFFWTWGGFPAKSHIIHVIVWRFGALGHSWGLDESPTFAKHGNWGGQILGRWWRWFQLQSWHVGLVYLLVPVDSSRIFFWYWNTISTSNWILHFKCVASINILTLISASIFLPNSNWNHTSIRVQMTSKWNDAWYSQV